jgi:RNA polymerase sigma-70 factor (ECF subfamily)
LRNLVERAAQGDRDAFADLAAAAIDRLYRVAYRILRDGDRARDATQEALLEAWRDVSKLRDPDRWEPWTYRLLVRACYRAIRRERGRTTVRLIDPEIGAIADPMQWVIDRDQLERAFRALPAEQRAVVVLHHYVGLSLTEIAASLGIPDGTARSRLHTATRRMRASLRADVLLTTSNEGRPA